MGGWLPARLADRSEGAKKSSQIWQVAGVNMQPWLCRMLQQLCTFPPRSFFLIMFPLSVELQLNVLHACVSLRI